MSSEDEQQIFAGYLHKSPPQNRGLGAWVSELSILGRLRWKKRWFILSQRRSDKSFELKYYENGHKRMLGRIDLNSVESVTVADERGARLFVVVAEHRNKERSYMLRAPTAEEREQWVHYLIECCELCPVEDNPASFFSQETVVKTTEDILGQQPPNFKAAPNLDAKESFQSAVPPKLSETRMDGTCHGERCTSQGSESDRSSILSGVFNCPSGVPIEAGYACCYGTEEADSDSGDSDVLDEKNAYVNFNSDDLIHNSNALRDDDYAVPLEFHRKTEDTKLISSAWSNMSSDDELDEHNYVNTSQIVRVAEVTKPTHAPTTPQVSLFPPTARGPPLASRRQPAENLSPVSPRRTDSRTLTFSTSFRRSRPRIGACGGIFQLYQTACLLPGPQQDQPMHGARQSEQIVALEKFSGQPSSSKN